MGRGFPDPAFRNAFNRVRIDSLNHFLAGDTATMAAVERSLAADLKSLADAETAYKAYEHGRRGEGRGRRHTPGPVRWSSR